MEAWRQLKLLLHRNLLLRRRQPVVLCLELLWPIIIFLTMMAARWSVPPVNQQTCRYSSWALPTVGAVPFLQSLICNIDNDCLNETQYEEVPFYPKSSIRALVDHLNPLMSDENITSFVTALPSGMRLLRAAVDIIGQPEIQDILDIGIPVMEILRKTDETKEVFSKQNFSAQVVDFFLRSYLKLPELMDLLISQPESVSSLCDRRSFHLLISPGEMNETVVEDVVTNFCSLSDASQNSILQGLIEQIDVENIVIKVSKVMSHFGREDISSSLHDIALLLQNMKTLSASSGEMFSIHDRLEFLVDVIEDLTEGILSKDMDFNLLSKIADDFAPLYENTDWIGLKTLLHKMASFSTRSNNVMSAEEDNTYDSRTDVTTGVHFYHLVKRSAGKESWRTTNMMASGYDDDEDEDIFHHFAAILAPHVSNETSSVLYRFARVFQTLVVALLKKNFTVNCDVAHILSTISTYIQQLSAALQEYFVHKGNISITEATKNHTELYYVFVGVETVLYTVGREPQKLMNLVVSQKPVEDLCTQPASTFVVIPSGVDDDSVEEGKAELCKRIQIYRKNSSQENTEDCSSDFVMQNFLASFGTLSTTLSTHHLALRNLTFAAFSWENIAQKYLIINTASASQIVHLLGRKLEEAGLPRPVFHTIHSILKFLVHKTENFTQSSNGTSIIDLEEIFPDAPLTRNAMESLLSHSPQIITTLFWSSLAVGKMIRLVQESHRNMTVALNLICNQTATDYLYNPAFQESDWETVLSAFCSHNYFKIFEEILDDPDIQEVVFETDNTEDDIEWEEITEDIVKVSSLFTSFSTKRNTTRPYLKPNFWSDMERNITLHARNPSVVLFLLSNSILHRFCYTPDWQPKYLPKEANLNEIYQRLCEFSELKFSENLIRNLTSALNDTSENNQYSSMAVYRAIAPSLKLIIQSLFGFPVIHIVENLEDELGYISNQRTGETNDQQLIFRFLNVTENVFLLLDLITGKTLVENLFHSGFPFIVSDLVMLLQTGNKTLEQTLTAETQAKSFLQIVFQRGVRNRILQKWLEMLVEYLDENAADVTHLCSTVENQSRNHRKLLFYCSLPHSDLGRYIQLYYGNNIEEIEILAQQMYESMPRESYEMIYQKLREKQYKWMREVFSSLAQQAALMKLPHGRETPIVVSFLKHSLKYTPEVLEFKNNTHCFSDSWLPIRLFNENLLNLSKMYVDPEFLLCNLTAKNVSSVYEWISKTFSVQSSIRQWKELRSQSQTIDFCSEAVQSVLHALNFGEGLTENLRSSDWSYLTQCKENAVNGVFLQDIIKQGKIFEHVASLIPKLGISRFSNYSSWKSLVSNFIRQLPGFAQVSDFQSMSANETSDPLPPEIKILKNSSLNLNWIFRHQFSSSALRSALCSKKSCRHQHILISESRDQILLSLDYLCSGNNADIFISTLNQSEIEKQLFYRQEKEFYAARWLQYLLTHSDQIENDLTNAIRAISHLGFDFSVDIFRKLVTTTGKQNFRTLVISVENINRYLEPIFEGSQFLEYLRILLRGLQAVKSLGRLNFFEVGRKLKDYLEDIEITEVTLKNERNLTQDEVETILLTRIYDSRVFSENGLDVENLCLHSNTENEYSIDSNIAEVLCYLDSRGELSTKVEEIQNVTFIDFVKKLIDLALEGVLQKARLTYTKVKSTVAVLKQSPIVLPVLSNHLLTLNTVLEQDIRQEVQKLNITSHGVGVLGTAEALKAGGKILCGKPLKAINKKFSLLINNERPSQLDDSEMAKLPSEFCKRSYKQVMNVPGGPIVWGFLKPLFRGKILYSPNTELTMNIIKQVTDIIEINATFEVISDKMSLLQAVAESTVGLRYLEKRMHVLRSLKKLISSELVAYLLKELTDSKSIESLKGIDLSSITDGLGDAADILEVVELFGNVSQCISFDRFLGFDTEEELEKAAGRLHRDREFIAAIVFLDESKFSKGVRHDSQDLLLPSEMRYKIRMDIDNIPSTKALRYRWWRPYAYDDFFNDLRYLRGFIQLQDLIDTAILRVYTNGKPSINVKKYLQQFPYPCHQRDKFGTILKGSIPAVMTVSWIFVIAFLVREIVLERQMSLDEIMRVMGLRPLVGWLSWFLSGLLVLLVSTVGIVVILKSGGIMPYSDPIIVFVFILIFAVLLLSYCYLISVFFKNAPAAALIAIIVYVLSFFPFLLYITWEVHFYFWQKIIACCLVTTAFCFGCLFINRFEDQGEGIQWSNIWMSPVPDDNDMSLALTMIIMMSCSTAYFLIAWYISRVWPVGREFTKQPWHFIFSLTYWGFRTTNGYTRNVPVKFSEGQINFCEESENYPAHDDEYGHFEKDVRKIGIAVRNLHVVFHRGSSKEKKAVDNLNLNLYEGHITTLLGKNGAGKTTTIKVLTGRCRPTYGEVTVCEIPMTSNNLSRVRKFIGYCPQYNILYDKLSVREHLCFFARLKGVLCETQLKNDIDEMLDNMGLTEKQNELTSFLSGGQKRRLCVALAFVGGSKVIILDEPTSSVDPVSRRDIWDLIVKYRKGRTILLCTHHLDEADILSDFVAVMHKGKLLCCGSPLQLKRKYGYGYVLTMSASSSLFSEKPNEGNPGQPTFFEKQEYSKRRMDDSSILEFIQSYVPHATVMKHDTSELVVSLPNEAQNGKCRRFSEFFKALDDNIKQMGFRRYSLSSTSLEQVFLTLCTLEDSKGVMRKDEIPQFQNHGNYICHDSQYGSSLSEESRSPVNMNFGSQKMIRGYKLKISQLYSLLLKRYEHTRRNWKTLMCTIALPCLFIALAMSLTVGKPKPKPDLPLVLNPNIYSPGTFSFVKNEPFLRESVVSVLDTIVSGPSNPPVCSEMGLSMNMKCQNSGSENLRKLFLEIQTESSNQKCICKTEQCLKSSSEPMIIRQHDVIFNLTGYDVSQYLINTYLLFNEKRYGGWTFTRDHDDEDVAKVWFDNSGYHAMPSYLNTLNSAILKANMKHTSNSQDFGIVTYNHPLQLSAEQLGQETLLHRLSEIGIAFVFLIGLSLIPSSCSMYIINERVHEEQRLQRIAGVGPLLYWSACILWDMFIVIVAVAFSALVIICFSLPTFVHRENFLAVICLVFLFGWATTPMTYLLSKFFEEASLAFMVLFSGNLFVGLVIMLTVISLQLITLSNESYHILEVVKSLALVFPQYSLVGGITELAQNQVQSEILALFGQDTYVSPFTTRLLLPNILILTLQGLIFFTITILLEWRGTSSYSRKSDNFARKRISAYDSISKFPRQDILKVQGLEKVYKTNKGRKCALKDLTLTVPKGECFGLLGVNGAGKTTLFRILTGHTLPSEGQVTIEDRDMFKVTNSGLQLLGYCPQSDALDNLLTTRQHLHIYARLRGIPQEEIQQVVSDALTAFDLRSHADCQVRALSGGNKRKVCTAIAMLGNPQLILLDEPTSGMDPVSRRLVWERIRCATREQKSVILSSHSIEECDVLCSRIGIMVNGRFCALGTPHQLKHEYGTGYTITLRMGDYNWTALQCFITKHFPAAKIKEHHCNTVEFYIPNRSFTSLSEIFKVFEESKLSLDVADLSVDQTTLDQVFIDFSRQQTDEVQVLPSNQDKKDNFHDLPSTKHRQIYSGNSYSEFCMNEDVSSGVA